MVINTLNFFYNGISYNDGSALDSLVASSTVWIHKVCVLLEPSLKKHNCLLYSLDKYVLFLKFKPFYYLV